MLDVVFMDSQGHSHEHMLGPFDNFAINLEKVSSFKSFKTKEIKGEISFKVNGFIDLLVMLMNYLIDFIREKGSISSTLIFAVVELVGDVEHGCVCFFSEIVN